LFGRGASGISRRGLLGGVSCCDIVRSLSDLNKNELPSPCWELAKKYIDIPSESCSPAQLFYLFTLHRDTRAPLEWTVDPSLHVVLHLSDRFWVTPAMLS
jgi:hypothetical protein